MNAEQKAALIEYCEDVISAHVKYGGDSDEEQVYRLALASLKAEPVADVVSWNHPEEERTCSVQLRDFHLHPGVLYTAPPVPVIKPVKLPEYRCSPDMHTKQFYETVGFNAAIDEVKRLNERETAMLQERRGYDKGAWVVVRECDRVVVHKTLSNREAHDYADRVTETENLYHYVDEVIPEIREAGIQIEGEE